MKTSMLTTLAMAAALGLVLQAAADHHHPRGQAAPASCPPGHVLIEEVTFTEVCREVCKYVPETKKVKKWVYTCKDDPFCIPVGGPNLCERGICGLFGKHKHCDKPCGHTECVAGCPSCEGPHRRIQLVKREIVIDEICAPKCVVEKIVERLPCKTYRAVPCGEVPPGATVVTPGAAPPAPLVEDLKVRPLPAAPKK